MQDEIHAIFDLKRLGHVLPEEPEAAIPQEVGEIPADPSEEVVDPQNAPVAREEMFAEMRSEESGRPRDQYSPRRSRAHGGARCGSALKVTSPRPRL